MDMKVLKANVVKIRKNKRLITELNRFIPQLNQCKKLNHGVPKIKVAIEFIEKFIEVLKETIEFKCE